jgi:hypothetical protein
LFFGGIFFGKKQIFSSLDHGMRTYFVWFVNLQKKIVHQIPPIKHITKTQIPQTPRLKAALK